MKKTLFASIVLLMSITGCKKENKPSRALSIVGAWELRSEFGGITGSTRTYLPGNGNIVLFNADSTFRFTSQSTVTNQGTFSIIKNGMVIGQSRYDVIYFNHGPTGELFSLRSDSLTIGRDYDDGIASVYVKQ